MCFRIALAVAAASSIQGADPGAGAKREEPIEQGPHLVISEFMARNVGGLKSSGGETPDWIEIYNPTSAAVNLAGWHLTRNASQLAAWSFPSTNLSPNACMVVFASGKGTSVAGQTLHTNFKLKADGGSLLLVSPDLKIVDAYIGYPWQEANISFASPISCAMSSGRVPGSMAARTMTTAPVTSAAACKARWNPRQ
jgi:hypothetical protein